jgi:hypothetical protein
MKTATNPQTGKRVYWDGEKWLPLQTATNKETGEVIGIVNGETFTVTPPRPREPESMREMIAETPERFRETRERFYTGTVAGDLEKLPPGFKATADIAAGISAAGETAGAVAGEAYKRYAPEALQEFVSESYEASDIKRGVEKLGELAQAYPEEATTAEIIANVSPFGPKTPTFSRPGVTPAGMRRAKGEATEARLEEERKAIADSLLPEDYVQAPGTVEPVGVLNRNVYIHSPSEETVIDYLHTLPDYKGDRNPAVNAQVVNGQLARHEADLQSYMNRSKNPKTQAQPLLDKLEQLKSSFHDLDEYVELMDGAQKQVDKFIDTSIKRLREKAAKGGTITAKDILEVRRRLDKKIFRKKPSAGLENPDLTSAKEVAGKYVRDELNQAFLKLMPDDEAYRLINGMSMLFRAKNLLDVKAGRAINQTMVSRTMKGIEDVSGLRFPTTPLAIAATAGAAGSTLYGFPVLGQIIGGAGVGMGVARMTRKRRRKEVVRELIRATDMMIKSGNVTAETLATLRADRVMLAQMLADINEEPENEQ